MKKGAEITYFPVVAEKLVPHKLPMRLIDSLDRIAERIADVTVKVGNEMPFVGENGRLDESAFLEMMAQAAATMQGIKSVGKQVPAEKGFLVGCKKLKVFKPSFAGDVLKVSVYKIAKYNEFGILEGTISRGEDVLATGEFKIWHSNTKQEEVAMAETA